MENIIFLEKIFHMVYCWGKHMHLLVQLVNRIKKCIVSDEWVITFHGNCHVLLCYLASDIIKHCIPSKYKE